MKKPSYQKQASGFRLKVQKHLFREQTRPQEKPVCFPSGFSDNHKPAGAGGEACVQCGCVGGWVVIKIVLRFFLKFAGENK